MSKQILSASGVPANSGPKTLKQNSIPRMEHNLKPEEIARLDFQPFGTRMIVEAVAPDTVTEGGVVMPFGGGDKPFYRIMRWGSSEYSEQITKVAGLGDVIFTRAMKGIGVFHRFPRLEQDGIFHDRILLLLDYSVFDGLIPGHKWDNPEKATREVGNMQIADFSDRFVNTVMTEMIPQSEYDSINFEPLSDKIIVEQVPSEDRKGDIYVPEAGRQKLPIFRIVKMSKDRSSLPPHAQHIEPGDLVLILGVNPQVDDFPTSLKKADGSSRELYLTSASFMIGAWPTLSYKNFTATSHTVSDTCTASESIS